MGIFFGVSAEEWTTRNRGSIGCGGIRRNGRIRRRRSRDKRLHLVQNNAQNDDDGSKDKRKRDFVRGIQDHDRQQDDHGERRDVTKQTRDVVHVLHDVTDHQSRERGQHDDQNDVPRVTHEKSFCFGSFEVEDKEDGKPDEDAIKRHVNVLDVERVPFVLLDPPFRVNTRKRRQKATKQDEQDTRERHRKDAFAVVDGNGGSERDETQGEPLVVRKMSLQDRHHQHRGEQQLQLTQHLHDGG